MARHRPRLHRRAARHVGRGAHHLLRWVGSFAAVLVLIFLFAAWRLMQGPIELNWLAPYVERAFDGSGMGLRVAVSGVRFGIDRTTRRLNLWAENVRVSQPDGTPLARFPELATSFSLGALLRGSLAASEVTVERPVLHLVRDAGGAVSAQVGAGNAGAPDIGPQMLEQLAGPRQRDTPLGLLHRLDIRGATVTVDDRRTGRTWSAQDVDLEVERGPKGVRGNFSLAMPLGTSMPEFRAYYRYFAERQVLDLDMSVDGVEPAALPPLIPEFTQLQHVDAPISGTLRTRIDLARRQAEGSRLDLSIGKGEVHSQWLPAGHIAIAGGEFHAVYAPETAEVRVAGMALDLGGGTRLTLDGTLGGVTPGLFAAPPDARPAGHVAANFAAVLTHVPVARFASLWPAGFSPGGRSWALANISHGVLDAAKVRVALDLDPVAHTASLVSAKGGLDYHDLVINYFDGLPPVRKVDGTATFAGRELDFAPTTGNLNGLRVTGGSLRLSNLGTDAEWLTIDLNLAGPLRDALEVIDNKPLRFAHEVGIDPAHAGGHTMTQLHFKLPLLAELELNQIDYAAKATITGADIRDVLPEGGLSDGNLALDISTMGAQLRGTARLAGVPAKLDASVPFQDKAGRRAVYRVATTLDDAAQAKLGLDVAPEYLHGPIKADATYTVYDDGQSKGVATLDLRDTTLAIPEADWKKPAGQPAMAKLALRHDGDGITRIPQIDIRAAGLEARLAAQFGRDGKGLEHIDMRRLVVGKTDVSGSVTRQPGGGWRADVHAARADARHLIKEATTGTPEAQSQPLAVTARIDRLTFGPQRELRQVTAQLLRTGGAWRSARIDGHYPNSHSLSLRFGEGDGHRLLVSSDDLGAALRLLDIADGINGGKLTIDGQIAEANGRRVVNAHVEGSDYTLERTPTVARLLALPSLTGFASTLSGSGLPFSTLRGDLVYTGNRLTFERLLAFGESLGVTASGWADLDHDRLDLQGTIAPAYLLNSMLGHFPVLGALGGGSQGLFAANYRLTGSSDNPQVTVNALSALAPGIIRQLFAPIFGVSAPAAPAVPVPTPATN